MIEISFGLLLATLYIMLSIAAPAPIINIFLPSRLKPLLSISFINPIPSVENKKSSLSLLLMVFTALIYFASEEILPSIFAALFL